jgi:hypothetical protein
MSGDLHVPISVAARLIGVDRITAWNYAKQGFLGPVQVVNRRGKLHVNVAELAKRFAIHPEHLRELQDAA